MPRNDLNVLWVPEPSWAEKTTIGALAPPTWLQLVSVPL